ncbi:hypothetical protein C8R43DRAFT_952596 [Mycena crocata]|nr:hypothetical protein C8R43DRAFT_952596 [Mycena crocata]
MAMLALHIHTWSESRTGPKQKFAYLLELLPSGFTLTNNLRCTGLNTHFKFGLYQPTNFAKMHLVHAATEQEEYLGCGSIHADKFGPNGGPLRPSGHGKKTGSGKETVYVPVGSGLGKRDLAGFAQHGGLQFVIDNSEVRMSCVGIVFMEGEGWERECRGAIEEEAVVRRDRSKDAGATHLRSTFYTKACELRPEDVRRIKRGEEEEERQMQGKPRDSIMRLAGLQYYRLCIARRWVPLHRAGRFRICKNNKVPIVSIGTSVV